MTYGVSRNKIVEFCQEYLKVKDFEDKCVNGLQVEGLSTIRKIVAGVSLSEKLVKAAIEKKAQMLIVHHGLFQKYIPQPVQIAGITKKRLKLLLANDINLCGFHLPLDAHPIIGNNISLCKLLGVKKVKPLSIGYVGELSKKVSLFDFVRIAEQRLDTKCCVIASGPKFIKKIAVVSGAASSYYKLAVSAGADTLFTGDIREEVVRESEEVNINIINGWHYNTEKLGIQNLGNLIAKKFKVSVEFVDIPCEI